MSDNLKTWPEKSYKPNVPYQQCFISTTVKFFDDDIEYIRADIAKEREMKLIASARNSVVMDCFESRIVDDTTWDVYKEAGLEELK